MSKKIRWGILGCGRIAKKFASDLRQVDQAELVAVGSRNLETAGAFAAEYPARQIHDSYEALASDPGVDVIYIATPHTLHYENTMLCLDHGKAVLCEKPFAINTAQAKTMIGKAREKNLFLMEAVWTKFLPHYIKMQEMIAEGKLGEIRSVLANFGFIPPATAPHRLQDRLLGGGTLMDIGLYNVFIALSVLGKPDFIESSATLAKSGIDEQCAVLFKYRNGAVAQLFSTFQSNLATEAEINGSKGRIRLTSRFYEPTARLEFYPGYVDSRQVIGVEKESGTGYQYEARHVCNCLEKGLTESPVMSHADTLLLIELLDTIRQQCGIEYPAD